jgi:putative ABC transport system substrate-binding protein
MTRREFITLLGGAAATWPLAASAQQPERMRRIGVLIAPAADDPDSQANVTAFAQGMQESGWGARDARKKNLTSSRNVRVQPCIRPLNAAVVAAGPDVIH